VSGRSEAARRTALRTPLSPRDGAI
jgi:hypothetical protein